MVDNLIISAEVDEYGEGVTLTFTDADYNSENELINRPAPGTVSGGLVKREVFDAIRDVDKKKYLLTAKWGNLTMMTDKNEFEDISKKGAKTAKRVNICVEMYNSEKIKCGETIYLAIVP
jgi:hypothetical protein